ncbi:MAG: nuclear transport factor 2 family protein [Baekduia sp.]|mgnify:CR=1 FL=1
MSETIERFREAVEGGDIEAGLELLSGDITFNSPAVHKAYRGKETVSGLLRLVAETFEDFRYTDSFTGDDGDQHILVFRARVGDRELQGLDILRLAADGSIAELTVMVRPASGLIALAQAMGPKVEAAGLTPAGA